MTPNNNNSNNSAMTDDADADADFFAPVFESALNRAVFVLVSVLVETVGNVLLYLLQAFVTSEVNAILCDRLVATLVRVWLGCNVAVLPFKVQIIT